MPTLELLALGGLLVMLFYAVFNLCIGLAYRDPVPIKRGPNPERVAVLVPVRDDPSVFNSHPALEGMDYPNYKVVICDDSTDEEFSRQLSQLRSDKTDILRRTEHIGRKSGALNFALQKIQDLNPRYVAIFDADHRPTEDFLKKAVACIEQEGVVCVCGYQKHDIGAFGLFGRFYRAVHAAGIVNFQGRNQLGLPTIFGGGCGLFDYEWLRKKQFDVTSITEDWELSCRSYADGDFSIVIRSDLYAHAAVPRGYRWFLTQQLRWSEGTISDLRKHLRAVLTSKHLDIRAKLGLLYQGLHYAQSIPVLASFVIGLLSINPLPFFIAFPILVFFGLSWAIPFRIGTRLEGYTLRETARVMGLGFLLGYVMAPVYAYSVVRGLISRRQGWIVTMRRG